MFGFYKTPLTDGFNSPTSMSYLPQVRAAHALADLLKRTRPHLYEQVDGLQGKVTLCQYKLDQVKNELAEATRCAQREARPVVTAPEFTRETISALNELENITQALLDLRHKGQMAR